MWISDKGSGQSQPLTLTTREPNAPISKDRSEALRQLLNELQGMCFPGCLDKFFAGGIELAISNVLGHGCVEKMDLLAYYSDLATPPCEVKLR